LHEVMELSDEITVLRDGRVSGRTTPTHTSRESLAAMMVGRPVELTRSAESVEVGTVGLAVRELRVMGDRDALAIDGVSIEVRRGEIVGVAGVSGNGQRELAEAIFGLRPITGGEVEVDGVATSSTSPAAMRSMGLSYVPEERMRDGAIGDFTVAENLVLVDHASAPIARRGLLDREAIVDRCQQLVDDFDVKTPGLDTPTRSLSGGNIQKVVIAREFSSGASAYVVAQPTRGVDIGAAEYIHQQLLDRRRDGAAILLISEDLDEVLQLSDRVVVLLEGSITGEVARGDADVHHIGLLMAGVTDHDRTSPGSHGHQGPEGGAT
ncbi:MAG: ATP-binding cassette domain-containing protein, partial [Actinomycetota bacterium]